MADNDKGWTLVPREPTPEMLAAFWRYKNGHHFHDEPQPSDTSDYGAYAAMLAAAPPIPAFDPVKFQGARVFSVSDSAQIVRTYDIQDPEKWA